MISAILVKPKLAWFRDFSILLWTLFAFCIISASRGQQHFSPLQEITLIEYPTLTLQNGDKNNRGG